MGGTYAHPDTLVTTDWVAKHADDPNVRIVEVDEETTAYDERGHVPGAISWNWKTQLNDPLRRDLPDRHAWERLLGASGISNDTTVVLYGGNNNWFAAFAFWVMKLYGHNDVRLMDGGRKRWNVEGRPLVKDVPKVAPVRYEAAEPDASVRALRPEVEAAMREKRPLIDVRSPAEFTGEVLAPPGLPETCQRGGHIPGARSIPWSTAVNADDGTFKPVESLREIYGWVRPDQEAIAYCRIGERSSHTWFVLKYLLGHPNVRNYDGSWTEWGNLVGAPIER